MDKLSVNPTQWIRGEMPAWKKVILLSSPMILSGLIALIYYPTFKWFGGRWFHEESYYSHGILIPILSGWMVWRVRGRLRSVCIHTDNIGLFVLSVGLCMQLFSAWARIHFISGLSLLVVLTGLIWYMLGRQTIRVIWFPLFFLSFMVPMPLDLIAILTLKLKLFAASLGSLLVTLAGITNIREGSLVYMPNTVIEVGAPCSGLKGIISFLAIGSLYAYVSQYKQNPSALLRRWLLVLLCVPIAVFANLVRVVLTLIIGNEFGNAILVNDFLHKGFGTLVFVVGIISFFALAKLLRLDLVLAPRFTETENKGNDAKETERTGEEDEPSGAILAGNFPIRALSPVLTSILCIGLVGILTFNAFTDQMESEDRYTQRFPEHIGDWHTIGDWYVSDPQLAQEVFTILETEDTIYRVYKDSLGNSVDLVLVYSAHNRKVAHPPDICFQGGGWQQQIKDTLPAPYGSPSALTELNRLILDRGGAKQIALYWYKSGQQQTASYVKQQIDYILNSVRRRNRGIALIRLTAYADSADQIEPKTQQLENFAKQIVPLVNTHLP